ncbi:MAG TPA: ASPIC/UnbV domain-containing protein, partial [Candidatus Dormibacteraeota bacterium]|nr:ASPIC/UnbV domain-containing protein [Candidatus Dormibacteraeota bacterium]
AGGQLGWTHVGLGAASTAQVRILWPDGTVGAWATIAADRYVTLARDGSPPQPWQPGPGG